MKNFDLLPELIHTAKNTETNSIRAKQVYGLLDLTSLNDTDNHEIIADLCRQTRLPFGHVAAVCIYSPFLATAVKTLQESEVKIATVANFPAGNHSVDQTVSEIKLALEHGADEVDVVMPYLSFLSGNETATFDFILACRQACDNATLKVILETGALREADLIYAASIIAIEAGADFIKTSTGKMTVNATLESAAIMLYAIQQSPSHRVGFKAAGGVRQLSQAVQYVALAEMILNQSVTPETFRIGASSLLFDVLHYL